MASCRSCSPSRNSPFRIFSRSRSTTADERDCLGIGSNFLRAIVSIRRLSRAELRVINQPAPSIGYNVLFCRKLPVPLLMRRQDCTLQICSQQFWRHRVYARLPAVSQHIPSNQGASTFRDDEACLQSPTTMASLSKRFLKVY